MLLYHSCVRDDDDDDKRMIWLILLLAKRQTTPGNLHEQNDVLQMRLLLHV
jgi:hypothetical protein